MQRKINIYLRNTKGFFTYESSTNWHRTCKEAKKAFLDKHDYLDITQVKASYK